MGPVDLSCSFNFLAFCVRCSKVDNGFFLL
jgi:hypothetical protein